MFPVEGAVGRLGAVLSDVNVGGASVLGKYPPPTDTTDPWREGAGCDMGDTSSCAFAVYPEGTVGRFGGGETFGAEKVGDGCVSVLGAGST